MATPVYEGEVYEDGQQFKDDDKLIVRFEMRAIKHKYETIQQGRPIYIDMPYSTVITPGSRDNLVTEATEHYQRRFAKQWAMFQLREKQQESGTPLDEIPWLTKSQIAELKAVNIFTVEHLVNMSDVL